MQLFQEPVLPNFNSIQEEQNFPETEWTICHHIEESCSILIHIKNSSSTLNPKKNLIKPFVTLKNHVLYTDQYQNSSSTLNPKKHEKKKVRDLSYTFQGVDVVGEVSDQFQQHPKLSKHCSML